MPPGVACNCSRPGRESQGKLRRPIRHARLPTMATIVQIVCVCTLLLHACTGAVRSRPYVDTRSGRFRLPDGRTADFHGACITESSALQDVNGLVNITDEKLEWFAGHGLNTLRLGVHWSLYETEPQVFNQSYLEDIAQLVSRLGRYNIWAIIDMHQDQWSGYYCSGHGIPEFYAAPPTTKPYDVGGKRAYPLPIAEPTWTSRVQPPSVEMNCSSFLRDHHGSAASLYTYALGAASQRLYDEPDLQAAFGLFWSRVAMALRSLPNVLAFELINEPWYGDVRLERGNKGVDGWQLGQPAALSAPSLMRLHHALHIAIRAVDDETLLLFEPGAGGAAYFEPTNYSSGPGGSMYDTKQCFSYHQYCPKSLDGNEWGDATTFSPSVEAAIISECNKGTKDMVSLRTTDSSVAGSGGAAIVTEFGQVNNNSVGLAALSVATDTFERYGQGWTIWSVQLMNWLQTNGVPGYSKLPEAPPENWLRPFARTYAAVIAGEVLEQTFDTQSGFYELAFSADPDLSVRYLNSTIKCSPSVHYKGGIRSSISPIEAGTVLDVSDRFGDLIFRPNDSLQPNERVTIKVWRVKD